MEKPMQNCLLKLKTSNLIAFYLDFVNGLEIPASIHEIWKVVESCIAEYDANKKAQIDNELIARFGWASALLCALIFSKANSTSIKENEEKFIYIHAQYTKDFDLRSKLIEQYNEAANQDPYFIKPTEPRKNLSKQIDELNSRVGGFPFTYADSDFVPYVRIQKIISDTHKGFPDFIKQSIIMAAEQAMATHSYDDDVTVFLRNILSCKFNNKQKEENKTYSLYITDYIDDSLIVEQYSKILSLILKMVDAKIDTTNVVDTIRIAFAEIPGLKEFLCKYPLKIDKELHTNVTTGFQELGRYESSPYNCTMWTRYERPVKQGCVKERYIQVDDLTIPNAIGIASELFLTTYAAIPVLYHENQHHLGDTNEGSVRLKTLLFANKLQKKYRISEKDAQYNTDFDFKFALSNGLDGINSFVLRAYGDLKNEAEVEKLVNRNSRYFSHHVVKLN